MSAKKNDEKRATVARWMKRLVRRIFWKRELERVEFRLLKAEWERDSAKSDAIAYKESYLANLELLRKSNRLVRDLKWRLSKQGQAERLRKPKLP